MTRAEREKKIVRKSGPKYIMSFLTRRGDPESSPTSEGCEQCEPYGAAACARWWVSWPALGDPSMVV